jgi:hypothetical protein
MTQTPRTCPRLAVVVVMLAGCGGGTTQEILSLRKELLKSSLPAGAVLIAQAKRALPTEPRVRRRDISVARRVGGVCHHGSPA